LKQRKKKRRGACVRKWYNPSLAIGEERASPSHRRGKEALNRVKKVLFFQEERGRGGGGKQSAPWAKSRQPSFPSKGRRGGKRNFSLLPGRGKKGGEKGGATTHTINVAILDYTIPGKRREGDAYSHSGEGKGEKETPYYTTLSAPLSHSTEKGKKVSAG